MSNGGTCALVPGSIATFSSCEVVIKFLEVGNGKPTLTARYLSSEPMFFETGTEVEASPVTVEGPHATSTAVACAPNPVTTGQSTACTVTVTDTASERIVAPTGTAAVTIVSGGQDVGGQNCQLTKTGMTTSACKIAYTPKAAGAQTIGVNYEPDRSHTASNASTTLTVAPPAKVTRSRKATFKFVADQAGSHFQCKLDKGKFKTCRSPLKLRVRPGKHVLQVRAVNAAGVADTSPATFRWKVL